MTNWQKRQFDFYNSSSFRWDGNNLTEYSPFLTMWEYGHNNDGSGNIVTNEAGWDDTNTAIEIKTEPLLLSSGSAVISKRLAEREITLEWSGQASDPAQVQLDPNLSDIAARMDSLTVVRTYLNQNDPGECRRDFFQECYITSITLTRDTPTDYSVKIILKVVTPEKVTIFQSGDPGSGAPAFSYGNIAL